MQAFLCNSKGKGGEARRINTTFVLNSLGMEAGSKTAM